MEEIDVEQNARQRNERVARAAENEQRQEERKNYDRDYLFPIMAWVTELIPNRLYIGPKPKTEENTGFILKNIGVSIFISLLPYDVNLYYTTHFSKIIPPCFSKKAPMPLVIRRHFDETPHKKKGNTKKEQLMNKGLFYAEFAKSLLKVINTRRATEAIYIHHTGGYMEEVFIGFALWVLMGEGPPLPKDPIEWIEKHNERLLDGDSDNKELMAAIWFKAKELNKATSMFFTVKKKQKVTEGSK